MKKISADYIFPISQPAVKEGILVTENDGTLVEVINPATTDYRVEDVQKYDGILCPGFINTHCHLELSHFRGLISPQKGLHHFLMELDKIRKTFSQDQISETIADAEKEMTENGTVAAGDISNTTDAFDVKRRSTICFHTFIEVFGSDPAFAQQRFAYALGLYHLLKDNDSAASIVPHSPYSVSGKLFSLIGQFAADTHNLLSIHHQENEDENLLFNNKSGAIPERMKAYGVDFSSFCPTGKRPLKSVASFLPEKNHLLLVHNTVSNEEDMLFARNRFPNLWLALCPNANRFIENRLPDIELFRKLNLNLTIGTDSLAANRQLSVLEEIKTISRQFPEIKTEEMLGWATLNGARFLKIDDTFGSFEKGKKPGIILINHIQLPDSTLSRASKAKRLL